jgi:hypothetical protein
MSSGVIGRDGVNVGTVAAPVIAAVMITFSMNLLHSI